MAYMNKEKTDIIINEIQYWKENKLLPETYCHFLLALYTEGNLENDKQVGVKKTKVLYFIMGLLVLLLVSTLLVTYFTELSIVLQTVTGGFFLVTSIVVTVYLIRKKSAFQLPLIITFLQLLITSINLVEYATSDNHLWIGLTVICNCLLWIVIGKVYRIYYLLISGLIAVFIFILAILFT
jgi:hypothetical protein